MIFISGWGWVVVIASIFGLSNWTIALRCYSVFYSDLIKDFNAEYSEVAILIGMFQAGYGISCFKFFALFKPIFMTLKH